MVRYSLLILFLLQFSLFAVGQKIKYKDLFVLLNAKQYDKAEPFLKLYLQENDDNPNAYLYMGIIFHDKAGKNNVLTETELLLSNIDSAVLFYDKAFQTIDEKEIRKNDEYYQAFNRRDFRTGKFGISLSDIQVDIETYIKGLNERKKNVLNLRKFFDESQAKYTRAGNQFEKLQSPFSDERDFYLQSDEAMLSALKNLSVVFDSSMLMFDNYKKTLELLGNTGYNQTVSLVEIKTFKQDGITKADFALDDLRLWDYKLWAESVSKKITEEINPLRDHLVSYDIKINKLRDKLIKDSVSVSKEIAELRVELNKEKLKNYDSDPLPVSLFNMKFSEIEYLSQVIENDLKRDSANVHLHLELLNSELKSIQEIDSLATKILSTNLEKEAINYQHFVSNAYGNMSVLRSGVKTMKDFAVREYAKRNREWENTMQALKWIVTPTDSIPLFFDDELNSKFYPIIVSENSHTAGLMFADTIATGYFYTITPAHRLAVHASFEVDATIFRKRNLPVTKGLSTTGGKGLTYFVLFYSETKVDDKYPVQVAKIGKDYGLIWQSSFQFELQPADLIYMVDSNELSVKTTSPTGENKMVVIDKDGKRIL